MSDDGLSETTNPVVVADDLHTATREFDSLLFCVQFCATNAVSESAQFQQLTLFYRIWIVLVLPLGSLCLEFLKLNCERFDATC